jgi:glycylpeptide N-tetradecanoyltransferase
MEQSNIISKSRFWSKKPIMQPETKTIVFASQIINPLIASDYSYQQAMFKPYEWSVYDINNSSDLQRVCDFLNKYYKLFPTNNKFTYYYTPEYLRWSLGRDGIILVMQTIVPGSEPGLVPAVKIAGLICGRIKPYQIYDKEIKLGDANYLCIHPKLHHKNIAGLLIDELTRLFITNNIVSGGFASSKEVGLPLCRVDYYHRPLNYKKLHDLGFVSLDTDMTLPATHDFFEIHYKHKNTTRKLNPEYYQAAYDLVCSYQDRYNYYEKYTLDSFTDTFINPNISSFVLLSPDGRVLDFYSYYKLPYKTQDNNFINAGYMHTYTTHNSTQLTIFKSALISAAQENLDIFTVPDTMENMEILYDNVSKFTKSDQFLYYNLYNLNCPTLKPSQIMRVSL